MAAIRLLGVRIDALRLSDLLARVSTAAQARKPITVLYVNIHCMNVAADDAAYRDALERADLVYCDGTGVRFGAWLAGQRLPERMTGADWIDDLCRVAVNRNLKLFLLGGASGVAEATANRLRRRFPSLRIVGTASGYERGEALIGRINAARADILLVGMGTPTQELWIDRHRDRLAVPVVWAAGALFDFVAGRIPRGPRWMTQHGLEWICRLAAEPRKLWRRYLMGNPRFLARVMRAYWFSRLRRASLRPGSGPPRGG